MSRAKERRRQQRQKNLRKSNPPGRDGIQLRIPNDVLESVDDAKLGRLVRSQLQGQAPPPVTESAADRLPRVYLGIPSYGNHHPTTTNAVCDAYTAKARVAVHQETNSLLARCFNRMWAKALSLAVQRDIDYFVMLHADINPCSGWLQMLLDEIQATGADLLSVVSPIKSLQGLTSTAVDIGHPWQMRRLTVREVDTLPETFTSDDVGGPLLVNTGCWIADLRKSCFYQRNEAGELRAFFTIKDNITWSPAENHFRVNVLPEDWGFSRMLHELGADIRATRKISLGHYGEYEFTNTGGWGELDTDPEPQKLAAIEQAVRVDGWMTRPELEWLFDAARKAKSWAEVGTWKGRSFTATAFGLPKGARLVAVDTFQGSQAELDTTMTEAKGGQIERIFREGALAAVATARPDLQVEVKACDSVEAAGSLNGDQFDIVFIDGAHTKDEVKRDLVAWMPKVRDGGILCGHDLNEEGVRAALSDVGIATVNRAPGTIWWVVKESEAK